MLMGERWDGSLDAATFQDFSNNSKKKVAHPKIEFLNQQQGDHLELVVDGERWDGSP